MFFRRRMLGDIPDNCVETPDGLLCRADNTQSDSGTELVPIHTTSSASAPAPIPPTASDPLELLSKLVHTGSTTDAGRGTMPWYKRPITYGLAALLAVGSIAAYRHHKRISP